MILFLQLISFFSYSEEKCPLMPTNDVSLDPRRYMVLEWNGLPLWDDRTKTQSETIGREGVLRIDFNREKMKCEWGMNTRANLGITGYINNWDGGKRNVEIPGYSVIAKQQSEYKLDMESASNLVSQIMQGSRFFHRIWDFDQRSKEESKVAVMVAYKALIDNYLKYLSQAEASLMEIYRYSLSFDLSTGHIVSASNAIQAAEKALKKQEEELEKAKQVEFSSFFRRLEHESKSMRAWLKGINSPAHKQYLDVFGQIIERDPNIILALTKEMEEMLNLLEGGKVKASDFPELKEKILTRVFVLYEVEKQVIHHYQNMREENAKTIYDSRIYKEQSPKHPDDKGGLPPLTGWPDVVKQSREHCEVKKDNDESKAEAGKNNDTFKVDDLTYVPSDIDHFLEPYRKNDSWVTDALPVNAKVPESFAKQFRVCKERRDSVEERDFDEIKKEYLKSRIDSIRLLLIHLTGTERYEKVENDVREKFKAQLDSLLGLPNEWKREWDETNKRFLRDCTIHELFNDSFDQCRERNDMNNTAVQVFMMVDIINSLINDLPMAEIHLDEQDMNRGDDLVISVSFRPAESNAEKKESESNEVAALQQAVFSFEAMPYGFSGVVPRIIDSTIYAKGKRQENYEPRSGVSAMWNYYGNSGNEKDPLRFFAPGFGITAVFLNFAGDASAGAGNAETDDSTFELGLGITGSLFDNLIQFTWGRNLSRKAGPPGEESRAFYGIGISFYETLKKIKSKK